MFFPDSVKGSILMEVESWKCNRVPSPIPTFHQCPWCSGCCVAGAGQHCPLSPPALQLRSEICAALPCCFVWFVIRFCRVFVSVNTLSSKCWTYVHLSTVDVSEDSRLTGCGSQSHCPLQAVVASCMFLAFVFLVMDQNHHYEAKCLMLTCSARLFRRKWQFCLKYFVFLTVLPTYYARSDLSEMWPCVGSCMWW